MNIADNILFWGFIFHFVGDYLLQNDWMAQNKTKQSLAAAIHATIYSALFLLLTDDLWQWLIILISHFLIDRFRLAVYWIKLTNWNWNSKNFGYSDDKPAWMAVWLMIIVDNAFHILINSICLSI